MLNIRTPHNSFCTVNAMPSLKRTRSFYGNDGYARLPKRARKMYERSRKTTSVRVPRAVTMSSRAKNPFPDKQVVTLRYCDAKTLDSTAGASAKANFSANSLHDPDRTGTGHQPYGYDQYAAIYNHYKVLRSKITCIGVTTSPGVTAGNLVLGIGLKDDTTTESDVSTLREAKGANFAVMSSYQKATVSNYWKKSLNFPNDGTYSTAAPIGSNPAEEMFFSVFSCHMDGSTEGGGCNIVITIEYVVEFFELKDLGQS